MRKAYYRQSSLADKYTGMISRELAISGDTQVGMERSFKNTVQQTHVLAGGLDWVTVVLFPVFLGFFKNKI